MKTSHAIVVGAALIAVAMFTRIDVPPAFAQSKNDLQVMVGPDGTGLQVVFFSPPLATPSFN